MNQLSEKIKYILGKMDEVDRIIFIKDGFIVKIDNKIIKVIYPNSKLYIGNYSFQVDFENLIKLRQKAIRVFDRLHSSRMQLGRW